jgi:hypothetical protein
MKKRNQTVVRQGSIYHVTINGTDYALFIWSAGKHFRGRVEGQPHVPEQAATTPEKVRAALCDLLLLPVA